MSTINPPQKTLNKRIPILTWFPEYRSTWLRPDFIAGLTVVALLVPEGMAYAELAGMPAQTAFYAAPIALLAYAILGTSRQLVVAVSATIAVMSAATVAVFHPTGSAEYMAMTSALAILAGLIAILAGFFKLGRIAQFFSESVLTGFVFGLALVISIKQVPKILGIPGGGEDFFERVIVIIKELPDISWPTFITGMICLAIMLLLERYFEKIPAALVVLVVGILLSTFFDLEALGVEVVGLIPGGLAAPKLPGIPLQEWLWLIPGAIGIALVNFAEAVGPAHTFANEHKYSIDADQELIGLGAANFGAGLFQAFPIGASLSKSAANDRAGARTAVSLIIAAGLTILVALFLTPLFQNLPEATLGVIVIVAVSGMMKVGEMKRLYRLRRADFWLAMAALFGVLIFDVLPGLIIAVAISLLALIWRSSKPKFSILQREQGTMDFSGIRNQPGSSPIPGLLILRPDEGIFFANAAPLKEDIIALINSGDSTTENVLLSLEMSNDLDVPACDMLLELHESLSAKGIVLKLARVHSDVRQLLDHSGVTGAIGNENIYPRVLEGVLAYLAQHQDWGYIDDLTDDGLQQIAQIIQSQISQASGEGDDSLKSFWKHTVNLIEEIQKGRLSR